MDEILREHLGSDYFANEAPDMWNKDQAKLYDIAAEIEYKVLELVEEIINSPSPTKRNRLTPNPKQ